MKILGLALSGSNLPFLSATARHGREGSYGEVVCETIEQCAATEAWVPVWEHAGAYRFEDRDASRVRPATST
jgi:hypothetical protein